MAAQEKAECTVYHQDKRYNLKHPDSCQLCLRLWEQKSQEPSTTTYSILQPEFKTSQYFMLKLKCFIFVLGVLFVYMCALK